MAKTVTKYMHTIDGKPAHWSGEQITLVSYRGAVELADSLQTIRRQQIKTREFRIENGFTAPLEYGYVRVRVD